MRIVKSTVRKIYQGSWIWNGGKEEIAIINII
jgi:hypothetical protein